LSNSIPCLNKLPTLVKVVEVGPRDGLQNEPHDISAAFKIELINRLSDTGLSIIEAGSFVSPEWVPKMANSAEVLHGIKQKPGVIYPVLVPNIHGFDDAIAAGARSVDIFSAASETFSHKNTNCSIAESLERFIPVMEAAKRLSIPVRGYISCALECPYEGTTPIAQVVKVARVLNDMGCYEIALGDTIGKGTARQVQELIIELIKYIPIEKLAVHFHNTYGQALANIYAALEVGVTIVDASISGLGGCPYAKGATGNIATEDVIYMLNGLGIKTGVSLEKLIKVSEFVSHELERTPQSKVTLAMRGQDEHSLAT
jgi:hydroxymethylglutaryl-CoA lyase